MGWFTSNKELNNYYSYRINVFRAFNKDPQVIKLWGKSFEKLSKEKRQEYLQKTNLLITYFPKAELYKIINGLGKIVGLWSKDNFYMGNKQLFGETIAGDPNAIYTSKDTHIGYSVWEREVFVEGKGNFKYLSVVKESYPNSGIGKDYKVVKTVLCEIPLFSLSKDELKQFKTNWEVKENNTAGCDFHDPFGEMEYFSSTEFKHKATGITFESLG